MTSSSATTAYDTADVGLFDPDQVHTATDQRSVGELLFDVDRQARMLLIDVTQDHAAQLLYAWPRFAAAAENLWQALPRTEGLAPPTATPIDRIAQISGAIAGRLGVSPWPPVTAPDSSLSDMTHTLDRAADLVHRFAGPLPLSEAGREDLQATRARIIHSLYLAAHAVTVALLQHGRTRQAQATAVRRPLVIPTDQIPHAVAPTTEWVRRMSAVEAAAASFAPRGQLPSLLSKEHFDTTADGSRLNRALAHWDVQAHRALAAPGWRDNMVLITRTQALITGTAMVLADAAAGKTLDPSPRLAPTLGRAGAAWADLGNRWDDLTPLNVRPTPQLLLASAEIRAATRQLAHDASTMASSQSLASRSGVYEGLDAVLHAVGHADELAYSVAEKSYMPNLRGRPRAMSIRAHNDIEAGRATAPENDVVWITPADIMAKHAVPIPSPVAETLIAAGDLAIAATSSAASAAAVQIQTPSSKSLKDPQPHPRSLPVLPSNPTQESNGPRR